MLAGRSKFANKIANGEWNTVAFQGVQFQHSAQTRVDGSSGPQPEFPNTTISDPIFLLVEDGFRQGSREEGSWPEHREKKKGKNSGDEPQFVIQRTGNLARFAPPVAKRYGQSYRQKNEV
jgi:hypothetical protein